MGKLYLSVILKGKKYKHTFINEGIKKDCYMNVLLSCKNSKAGQFICYLNTGHMCIPSTSRLFNCESAKLCLELKGKEFENYKFKSFVIPIHCIASYDNYIDKNINLEYTL